MKQEYEKPMSEVLFIEPGEVMILNSKTVVDDFNEEDDDIFGNG